MDRSAGAATKDSSGAGQERAGGGDAPPPINAEDIHLVVGELTDRVRETLERYSTYETMDPEHS